MTTSTDVPTYEQFLSGRITESPNCCSLATLSGMYWTNADKRFPSRPVPGAVPSAAAIEQFKEWVRQQFASIRNGTYKDTCTIQAIVVDRYDDTYASLQGKDPQGYGEFLEAVGFVPAVKYRGSHGNDLIMYCWFRGVEKKEDD